VTATKPTGTPPAETMGVRNSKAIMTTEPTRDATAPPNDQNTDPGNSPWKADPATVARAKVRDMTDEQLEEAMKTRPWRGVKK
jgi:hypothetical protein